MGVGAKDQTNYQVAGSSRNVSQDSGRETQEDAVERMWTRSTNSECVEHGSVRCICKPGQWAASGKHGLQEAKKLEQAKRPKRRQATKSVGKSGQ